jgi:hypothetical protein
MDASSCGPLLRRKLMMDHFFRFLMYSFGFCCVSLVLARAEILEDPKEWILIRLEWLLNLRPKNKIRIGFFCSMCIGFYVGTMVGFLILLDIIPSFWISRIIDSIFMPFIISIFSIAADKAIFKKQ